MAEDDIYGSKTKYERLIARLDDLVIPRNRPVPQRGRAKYHCKNAANLAYFKRLVPEFAARDLSYTRRIRLFRTLKLICYATEKDLAACDRDEVNAIVGYAHSVLGAAKSKRDFIIDLKHLWRTLLPDTDDRGRPDETVMPYVVRHLSSKVDKSREQRRNEKLTLTEYEQLLQAFAQDKRLQAFIAVSVDSLRRPQELLYTRIRDVELHDNYAKVWISSHGKEGPGLAQCIDSFPYLAAWYNEHPLRHDPDAYLFLNLGTSGRYEQLKPATINKHLRNKLRVLGIDKRITCYSFKRNGVTLSRLRGDSDVTIQRKAGWTSTQQLRTYDLSDAEDAMKIELVKRGLVTDERLKQFAPESKPCGYCGHANGSGDATCRSCKRPLDREHVEKELSEQENAQQERARMEAELNELRAEFGKINAFMNKLVKARPEVLDVLAEAATEGSGNARNGRVQMDALQRN